MAEGGLWFYVSGIGAAIAGLGSHIGMLYLAEKNADIAMEDYLKFLGRVPSLRKLEEEIGMEAWRWPIYARPVFYTPIDQIAQIFFSNAQRAIYNARELEGTIRVPPERPASLRELLSFGNNWQRYSLSLEIQSEVTEFEETLNYIEEHLKTLRQSHTKEETLQENTRINLEILGRKIEETGERISGQSRGKKFDENVDWAQKNAKNCFLEAQHQLALHPSDGINFAIADLFIQLGNYILEHFDMYEKEFAIPVRFELDHFEHHLGLFQKSIAVMLTGEIDNWQVLHATARMLVLVNQQMQKSSRSLNIFLEKQNILHTLEQQIQTLNFPQIAKEIQQAEKNCEDYWKPVDQDASIWVKVLGSHPLPGITLDDARRAFQADIAPSMGPDAVIKQTAMIKLIEDIKSFFQKINLAKANRVKLLNELEIHKLAQIEVNLRLGPAGSTYRHIRDLAPIEPDTSPEIQQKCISCRKDFDVFQARARVVQGANFPNMLVELDAFEKVCSQTRQQHEVIITGLKRQADELVQQLSSLQDEINQLVSRKPRIEYDVADTRQKLHHSINSYSGGIDSFRELKAYISKTKPVIGGAKKDKLQLEKMWKKFVGVYDDTSRILRNAKQQLDEFQASSEESWAWTQKAYKKVLKSASNSYQKYSRALEQITTLDVTIKQAVGMCQRLQEEIQGELSSVSTKLQPIQQQQVHLANRYEALFESTRKTTMFDFTKNSDLVKEFCTRAEKAGTAEAAEMNLNFAEQVLQRSLPREDAISIINHGMIIDKQITQPGAQVMNAARDVNQFGKQPGTG